MTRDLGGAGDLVFPREVLSEQRKLFAMESEPFHGELVWARDISDEHTRGVLVPDRMAEGDGRLRTRERDVVSWTENPRDVVLPIGTKFGRWKVWCNLVDDAVTGQLRPPQDTVYLVGVDPGGGRKRNPAPIVVFDARSGEQVAEMVTAEYGPSDTARLAVAAALWFGGREPAWINWETNGVGGSFGEYVHHRDRLHWPNCRTQRRPGVKGRDRTRRYGWANEGWSLRIAVEALIDKMASGQIRVRSHELLDDAETWIVYEGGRWGPSGLAGHKDREREDHGDLVIAAVCATMLLDDNPSMRGAAHRPRRLPPRSFAAQYQNQQRRLAEDEYRKRVWGA